MCVCVCVNSVGIKVWVPLAISMKSNGLETGINPVLPGTYKDVNETQLLNLNLCQKFLIFQHSTF
jgi:hypothetical protein